MKSYIVFLAYFGIVVLGGGAVCTAKENAGGENQD